MRVGIASIALESNTFNPNRATLDDFRANTLLVGNEIHSLTDTPHEVGGFLAGLKEASIEPVPLLVASAVAGGIATAETFDALLDLLDRELDEAGKLDGLLLAPHGAMVAEQVSYADADGFWLQRVRDRVGSTIPVIATCDPHANVSPTMIAATDAIIAYQTNPHLDQRDRGLEAARLMARTLRGEVQPVHAACFPPMQIGIERQSTAEPPCSDLITQAAHLSREPGLLSVSLIFGFPYADVAEMGSATIAVADGDRSLAVSTAALLGRSLWQRREELVGNLVSIEEAVANAASLPGTTCLLDMGDNIGGGSPGDGTALLHELRRQSLVPALATLCDANAVSMARSVGIGSRLTLLVGGRIDRSAEPFGGECEVLTLTDGKFRESEVRHGGRSDYDQGPTAVVCCDGVTIVVTSRPCSPFSLGQITHTGLDPRSFRAIVAKGVHAPTAAYAPVCETMLRVDTPGLTAADPRRFTYSNRRTPMFPFETSTLW